jgi:hypothetical protein
MFSAAIEPTPAEELLLEQLFCVLIRGTARK